MHIVYLSILLAIIFIVLSLPNTYIYTDKAFPHQFIRTTFDNCPGVPTIQGTIVHAILFFMIAYIILRIKMVVSSTPPSTPPSVVSPSVVSPSTVSSSVEDKLKIENIKMPILNQVKNKPYIVKENDEE